MKSRLLKDKNGEYLFGINGKKLRYLIDETEKKIICKFIRICYWDSFAIAYWDSISLAYWDSFSLSNWYWESFSLTNLF